MEVNFVLLKSEPQTKMFYSRCHLAIIDPYLIWFIYNVPTSQCFSTALGNVIHNGESFPTQFFHASWQKKTLVAIELFLLLSADMSWGSLYSWKCFFIVRSYFSRRTTMFVILQCWLAMDDCMCMKLVPCSLWHGIRFWLYMHPKVQVILSIVYNVWFVLPIPFFFHENFQISTELALLFL